MTTSDKDILKKIIEVCNSDQKDYKKVDLNEGFEFNNPNERDRCGCGESFRV